MPQIPRQTDQEAETDEAIWLECAERLKLAEEAESINRVLAIEDLEFADGQQWPDDLYNMRKVQRRPSLTINHTGTLVRRVVNNMKEQRPRIKVHPVGDGVRIEDAKVVNGITRHIEYLSNADVAYDLMGESAVRIGWGYLRILNEYVDEKSFDQELKIKGVRNALTGYIDPSAEQPDGSDMNWFIFSTKMKRRDFKRQFPGVQLAEWTHGGPGDSQHQWLTKEDVRLAEYYRVKKRKDTLLKLTDGRSIFGSEFDKETFRLAGIAIAEDAQGKEIRRPTERRQIQWFLINGTTVVDRRDLPGHWIPVVRCEGNVLDLNGDVRRKGMIRDMKDPARMFNYWEPLALDTPIPTPQGWLTMGELREGDSVFDETGKPCKVLGKSPVHIHRPCFRVTFDDDSSIVADALHPWIVEERGKRTETGDNWTTRKVATSELTPKKHFAAVPGPLQTDETSLPIDPYVLGAWLGDGTAVAAQITQGEKDIEEMRGLLCHRGFRIGVARKYGYRAANFTLHGLREPLGKLGLLGNKHIPSQYLRASESQRLALLQGLMDTDGSCGTAGQCSFTTVEPRLALRFSELLRSLGIKAVVRLRQREARRFADDRESPCREAFQFSFTTRKRVFRLTRKLANLGKRAYQARRTQRYGIVSVEPVESVPVQCIAVDSASHLFLAGPGMIPTHNTAKTEKLALSSKAPWVGVEGQFDGHPEWDDANQKPYSVLKYKLILDINGQPLPNVPPPQRTAPAEVEAGFAEASQSAVKNLLMVSGMPHDPQQDTPGTVVSGIALRRRQAISDISHFQYYDNQTMAIAQVGRILLDLIPFYYGEARMQRIIGEDGVPQMVGINQRVPNPSTGVMEIKNNLQVGRYDVVMDTGPGYETKRQEEAEKAVDLMKIGPLAEVAAKTAPDAIFRYFGMDDIADRVAVQTPQGMQRIMESLPQEAKGVVQALQGQVTQLQQALQAAHLEIKYKTTIEQGWQQVEREKVNKQSATKIHDTETRRMTELDKAHIDAQAGIAETEIATAGKVVHEHVKGAYAKEAAKDVEKAADKAEKGNGSV